MPGETILLADDETDIGEILGLFLQAEGYRMRQAFSGAEAVELTRSLTPHLIVLDVFLPDTDGYELCKQLREFTKAPILFLSCKDNELDRIIGLSVGGDDYIGKPFSPNEVVARIKAHLRRSRMYQSDGGRMDKANHHPSPLNNANSSNLTIPIAPSNPYNQTSPLAPSNPYNQTSQSVASRSLKIDLLSHDVYVEGRQVELSVKEFQLLLCFMNHPRQVLTSEQLLRQVWGHKLETDSKTLHVHIGTLRKKIEEDPAHPKRIVTLRGVGYKFSEDAEAV